MISQHELALGADTKDRGPGTGKFPRRKQTGKKYQGKVISFLECSTLVQKYVIFYKSSQRFLQRWTVNKLLLFKQSEWQSYLFYVKVSRLSTNVISFFSWCQILLLVYRDHSHRIFDIIFIYLFIYFETFDRLLKKWTENQLSFEEA